MPRTERRKRVSPAPGKRRVAPAASERYNRRVPRRWRAVVNDTLPWWLWPNVLALDAPVVAVVWQRFLTGVAGSPVPLGATVALGLIVWGVYLGDRALDAMRGANASDRHRFAARHATALVRVSAAALLAGAAVAVLTLPVRYLCAGALVAAGTGAYLVAVHAARGAALKGAAKVVLVGAMFAAGVAIPLAAAGTVPVRDWLPGCAAFAGLCALNCALIARWEDGPAAPPAWLALATATVAVGFALAAPVEVAGAVFASAVALAALHIARPVGSTRAARVLADVALLSPVVAWGLS